MNFKWILFLFFLVLAWDRIISVFKPKEKHGKIEYIWTSFFLISSYVFCVFITLFDFIFHKDKFRISISIFGLFILLIGIMLRKYSFRALGDNWSIHIKDIPDQQLIKVGIYKWLRHPYYLAVIFELTGLSLYFNSFFSLGYIYLIHLPLIFIRIFFEEKKLILKFQDEYKKYRQETKFFLPRLF